MVRWAPARARMCCIGGGLLYRSTRGGVKDEDEVNGGDGDEVWWVEEAELGAVSVVDDEPRRNPCTSIYGRPS